MCNLLVRITTFESFFFKLPHSYSCASKTSREDEGNSRIWNGKNIKKNTEGNSALYVLEDEVLVLGIIFHLNSSAKQRIFMRTITVNYDLLCILLLQIRDGLSSKNDSTSGESGCDFVLTDGWRFIML